jgi:hypothetical protein
MRFLCTKFYVKVILLKFNDIVTFDRDETTLLGDSFSPNFNNKTTSVARKSHTQKPHYLI